ncbi:MAG: IS630 family transposase [Cyanobacteria bacterium P01_F01_bin.116]
MSLTREITPETQHLLERIYRQSRHRQVSQRAHCLWLKSQGLKNVELRRIFPVSEKTLYNWFNAWNDGGLLGLYDRPGRGRRPKLNDEQQAQAREWAQASPRNLKGVLSKIKTTWNIKISLDTLKRILKSVRMSWRRMRRVPATKPPTHEYERKRAALDILKCLDDLGCIGLYYLDETGFTLVPPIPYAWQVIGETLEIPSQSSGRLNVLGIMHRQGDLESYVSEQSITSDVVAACIDAFFPNVDQPTVIVMDQASIHTGQIVWERRDEWAQRGIYVFELPVASPELNLIEIPWRFMKYEWIDIAAYESWQSLKNHVEEMLIGFGKEFVINFA